MHGTVLFEVGKQGVEMIQELDISPELLAELKQFAGVAKDQMLEVVNEYLAWWFWVDVVAASCFAAATLFFAACSVWLWKSFKRTGDAEYGAPAIMATIAACLLPIGIIVNSLDAVKITVAPRAYIVDMVIANGRR